MKTFFRNALIAIFSFIVLTTALVACSNPFATDEEEKATFTISIGTNSVKANNSRAVAYPPGPSEIANLKFVVKFTPLAGGTAVTFTATGNSEFSGNVKTGQYKVTMEVYTVSDNLIYARGVADENPIEIKATGNFIHVDAYNEANAYPPVIKVKPKDAAYHVGATADDLTVQADTPEDGGTLEYQWYENTADNITSGTAITGATSTSYTPSTVTSGTTYYYVKITNNHGTPTSIFTMPVSVYVGDNAETPQIKTPPTGSPVGGLDKNSTTFTLTVDAEIADGGTLTYQWYSNTANDNTSGTAISGATSASYKPPTATAGTIYYYVIITNTNTTAPGQKTATKTSNAVAVTVNPSVDASTPTIAPTGQPAATTTISVGGTATLTVAATASDGGAISYQWYSNGTASNTSGSSISGATSTSYTTPNTLTVGDHYYYCVVTNTIPNNGDGGTKTATATSNVAKVTVNSIPNLSGTIAISPTSATIGMELTATYSGSETVSYQWKKDGADIGTNSSKYTPTATGSYTVTASATGYNSKTSSAVTVTSTFGSNTIEEVAYGNGTFVAGGGAGKMAYSSDGTTWTAVANSTFGTNTINAIAWGNGTFVAGGMNGKMAHSADGITWTAVANTTFSAHIYAIAYCNGTFVAGDFGKNMATSADGVTWTAVANTAFTFNVGIYAIAYCNGTFVAGGGAGQMVYSSDGTTWTEVTDSTFGPSTINEIAWDNDKFVAVGGGGKMAHSTDGVTWTTIPPGTYAGTTNFDTASINTIAWNGSKFVAGGAVGRMAHSTDGTTWTAVANTTFSSAISGIAYGNGTFVAGGMNGKMAYSPDGITWTAINTGIF
jgi:hypothetical protein